VRGAGFSFQQIKIIKNHIRKKPDDASRSKSILRSKSKDYRVSRKFPVLSQLDAPDFSQGY
jgi:hypothetical protein